MNKVNVTSRDLFIVWLLMMVELKHLLQILLKESIYLSQSYNILRSPGVKDGPVTSLSQALSSALHLSPVSRTSINQ